MTRREVVACPRPTRDDRGSVLLLTVGLVAIVMLAAVVGVDASAAFLQRRQLTGWADAAALAGAQGIDLEAYYESGASASTRLDPGTVIRRVHHQLADTRAADLPGFALDRVWSDGLQVRVRVSAPLRLPFLSGLFPARVVVESGARLAYRSAGDPGGPYP